MRDVKRSWRLGAAATILILALLSLGAYSQWSTPVVDARVSSGDLLAGVPAETLPGAAVPLRFDSSRQDPVARALQRLLESFWKGGISPRETHEALSTLRSNASEAVALLEQDRKAASFDDVFRRWLIVEMHGHIGSERSLPALRREFEQMPTGALEERVEQELKVQRAAVRALAEIPGGESELLRLSAEHPHRRIRAFAAEAYLGTARDPKKATLQLQEVLSAEDLYVVHARAEMAQDVAPESAVGEIRDLKSIPHLANDDLSKIVWSLRSEGERWQSGGAPICERVPLYPDSVRTLALDTLRDRGIQAPFSLQEADRRSERRWDCSVCKLSDFTESGDRACPATFAENRAVNSKNSRLCASVDERLSADYRDRAAFRERLVACGTPEIREVEELCEARLKTTSDVASLNEDGALDYFGVGRACEERFCEARFSDRIHREACMTRLCGGVGSQAGRECRERFIAGRGRSGSFVRLDEEDSCKEAELRCQAATKEENEAGQWSCLPREACYAMWDLQFMEFIQSLPTERLESTQETSRLSHDHGTRFTTLFTRLRSEKPFREKLQRKKDLWRALVSDPAFLQAAYRLDPSRYRRQVGRMTTLVSSKGRLYGVAGGAIEIQGVIQEREENDPIQKIGHWKRQHERPVRGRILSN